MAAATEWTKPPPDAMFNLRVPVEYASIHAAVRFPNTILLGITLTEYHRDWWLDHIFMHVLYSATWNSRSCLFS